MNVRVLAIAIVIAGLSGCEREERSYSGEAPTDETYQRVALSTIAAGDGSPVVDESAKGREYENNAYHMSQGKRLYAWFNCNGCHANGGGGSGPALMDDSWTYGARIENIVETIREGRPNGMPSFRGRIPDDQIWEIAAYVRSMGRYVRKDVAPSRNDDLNARPAENRLPYSVPDSSNIPPSAVAPQ
jgi:cytochrome c oxidase cbb3-type subunit III